MIRKNRVTTVDKAEDSDSGEEDWDMINKGVKLLYAGGGHTVLGVVWGGSPVTLLSGYEGKTRGLHNFKLRNSKGRSGHFSCSPATPNCRTPNSRSGISAVDPRNISGTAYCH
jgi:hypothetical protein